MYVTLYITATSIKLLSVKGGRVDKWGSTSLAPGLVRDGLILQPKAVGVAIDALFKSMKVPKKRVITSLTALPFAYRILHLPWMKPALLEEAIQRGVRKEISLPLEELYLSWQAIGSRHDELDFFVLGVPQNLINAMVETLDGAGIKAHLADLKPLALARAANRGDAIIVSLEPDCFDIVLVADGIPVIMHTVTPRGEGASPEDNVRLAINELSKTVAFYNSSHPQNPISLTTPLLLTGELSADATISQLVHDGVHYPIEPLVPPLEFPSELPVGLYATNMGLALKKVSRKTATLFRDINLNILSGKYRAGARPILRRSILLSLALLIAIGLLYPLYQVRGQAIAETMRLQNGLSEVSQELRQVRLALNQVKQMEEAINKVEASLKMLKEEHRYILNKGGGFANYLELVTNVIPSEAHFTSIEIGAGQITVEGRADDAFTVVNYAMALAAQGAFSEIRIVEIDEVNTAEIEATETAVISFTIVITR